MMIGIPKETKAGEVRVALVPEHVALLVEAGHKVRVERDAGRGCRIPDKEYQQAGARILNSVYDSEMIVRVKGPPRNSIRPGQIIMGYLHVQKGQDPVLLEALLEKRVTGYAYEEIRDSAGQRLVNLGVEAGIVGMYEGLRLYGKVLAGFRIKNRFSALPPARQCFSSERIFAEISKGKIAGGVSVYILGRGRVSQGAQQVLQRARIEPRVLWRRETAHIARYLQHADIVVNAVDWYPNEPRIIRKEMLMMMKKLSVIVDVSCDVNGAVETCIPTSWGSPTYAVNGITHLCVDNLPSAVPRDASARLSGMIIPHVLRVAAGGRLPGALMTKDGRFVYRASRPAAGGTAAGSP